MIYEHASIDRKTKGLGVERGFRELLPVDWRLLITGGIGAACFRVSTRNPASQRLLRHRLSFQCSVISEFQRVAEFRSGTRSSSVGKLTVFAHVEGF